MHEIIGLEHILIWACQNRVCVVPVRRHTPVARLALATDLGMAQLSPGEAGGLGTGRAVEQQIENHIRIEQRPHQAYFSIR